jgi:Flp pilus assembly protein TadG
LIFTSHRRNWIGRWIGHRLGHRISHWPGGLSWRGWGDDRGAQLVEFAVALPLLVFFVVGIFDFSNAYTFKQKLTNVARDAARVAASDPANDLQSYSTSAPVSVIDAFYNVDNYLQANNINDCSIGTTPSPGPLPLMWTYTATGNGCPTGGLTIIVNRGYYFPSAAATQPATENCQPPLPGGGLTQTVIIGTCVSIQYGYQWRFGSIASVLGRATVLPTTISAAAIAMNEN